MDLSSILTVVGSCVIVSCRLLELTVALKNARKQELRGSFTLFFGFSLLVLPAFTSIAAIATACARSSQLALQLHIVTLISFTTIDWVGL
jgi:hypothetical protein